MKGHHIGRPKLGIVCLQENAVPTVKINPDKQAAAERHIVMHIGGISIHKDRVGCSQCQFDIPVPISVRHDIVHIVDISRGSVIKICGIFIGEIGAEIEPEFHAVNHCILFLFIPALLSLFLGCFLSLVFGI